MKKAITTLSLLLIIFVGATAQSIRESRINVMDADRMGFSIEFNYEQKVLQDAWQKKCDELNIKGKSYKGGLNVFAAVLVPDIHFESIDVYADVERSDKSKS